MAKKYYVQAGKSVVCGAKGVKGEGAEVVAGSDFPEENAAALVKLGVIGEKKPEAEAEEEAEKKPEVKAGAAKK